LPAGPGRLLGKHGGAQGKQRKWPQEFFQHGKLQIGMAKAHKRYTASLAGVSLAITVSPVRHYARPGGAHLYDAAHKSANAALSYMTVGRLSARNLRWSSTDVIPPLDHARVVQLPDRRRRGRDAAQPRTQAPASVAVPNRLVETVTNATRACRYRLPCETDVLRAAKGVRDDDWDRGVAPEAKALGPSFP
jgi:hypothetical protein